MCNLQNKCSYQKISLFKIKEMLKLYSRADFDDNILRLEWTSSGFTIEGYFEDNIYLTNITCMRNNTVSECVFYTIIDGNREQAQQSILTTDEKILVCKNIKPGHHIIQFFKATEAYTQVTVGGIEFCGKLYNRPKDKSKMIQFIGDSITSASGLYTLENEPNKLLHNNGYVGYAARVADFFDWDLSIVSLSGGSVCTKKPIIPDYYERKFCYNKEMPFNFDVERQPDIVVISLGTNDTPSYISDTKEDVDNLRKGISNMLKMVRQHHPEAIILWIYGMMARGIENVYSETVNDFASTDKNTYYKFLNRNGCTGDAGHPSPEGHIANSKELIEYIKKIIK